MRPTWMLVIIAIVLSSSFANAIGTYSTDYELSLQQLLENRTNCVREISGDKIYLRTDSISISEEGTYVQLNEWGDCAFIPVLCADAAGCFIHVGLTSESRYILGDWANSQKKTCPGCKKPYFTSCTTKDCPLKKKN